MNGWHVTTPKKLARYKATGAILPPVRFWSHRVSAEAWADKTGRTVIVPVTVSTAYPLPDHHPRGHAWWSPNVAALMTTPPTAREELEQMEEEWVDCTEHNPYTCPGFEPHQHLARDIAARKRRWAMVHNHGREDRECRESLIGDCLREALDAAVRAERERNETLTAALERILNGGPMDDAAWKDGRDALDQARGGQTT